MVVKDFPNNVISWGQYNFGEKPSVILYTNIIHHVGTPKQKNKTQKNTIIYKF